MWCMQPPSAQTHRMTACKAPKQPVKESRVDGTYRSDGTLDRGGLLLCIMNSITWTLLIPLIGVASFFHFRGRRQRQPPPPCLDSGPPCLVSVKLYPDTRLNHTHGSLSLSPCLVSVKLYSDIKCTRLNHTHRSLGLPHHVAHTISPWALDRSSLASPTMSGKRQTLP